MERPGMIGRQHPLVLAAAASVLVMSLVGVAVFTGLIPPGVFSRSQLLDNVWGDHVFIEERTVDVHVLRLRKALMPANAQHLVQTVRGLGYRLSARPEV